MLQALDTNTILLVIALVFLLLIMGGAGAAVLIRQQSRRRQTRQGKGQRSVKSGTPLMTQPLGANRIRQLSQLLTELTSTLKYQRVLEQALDTGIQAVSSSAHPDEKLAGAVLLFGEEDGVVSDLYVAAARRFAPPDLQQTFPAQSGVLKEVIDEGAPVLGPPPSQDPELKRVFGWNDCAACFCLPLKQGIDTYGIIVFAHPDPQVFNSTHREILRLIAHQAIIAIQNARLFQELEQEKERLIEAQENARQKLARDLHDGPTQTIAAIAMRANMAQKMLAQKPQAALKELQTMEEMARRTTQEIRHMLFTLRPLVLETQGLVAALEAMAEKMRDTYGQNVLVEIDPQVVEKLEMEQQSVIFAIAEEAVNNARKHAEAEHIWVRLRPLRGDIALLEIRDDGVGFDAKAVLASYEQRGSLGLLNLRERSELINGIFHLDSEPGKGTRVQVAIPLTEAAIERLRHRI